MTDGLERLVRAINPTPAYVRNARLDILAWNDAIADLFIDYGSLQPHERNTLRLLFLYRPYRTQILDWEQMARGVISVFRASRAHAQDKRTFEQVIEELAEKSPEIKEWWQDTDVKGMGEGSKHLLHPTSGYIEFIYVALMPEGRPDLSLVTYIPRHVACDSQS